METTVPQPDAPSRSSEASALDADRALIRDLGGPTAVARLLNLGVNGAQRVANWQSRGIPARVKLSHPKVFLADLHTSAGGRP